MLYSHKSNYFQFDVIQKPIHNRIMLYTKEIKNEVRNLRANGFSLNQIQEKTKVPKSTIRTWILEIVLTKSQKEALTKRARTALQEGRRIAQQIKSNNIKLRDRRNLEEGEKEIGRLTKRELFITGVALYWGEGFKNVHERRLGFCNSDPVMLKFYLNWLRKCLKIKKTNVTLRLSLNYSYAEKNEEFQEYWSKLLKIPINQFTKTFYQKADWKRSYQGDSYRGVLRIHVKESSDYLSKMKGWIEGLKLNI